MLVIGLDYQSGLICSTGCPHFPKVVCYYETFHKLKQNEVKPLLIYMEKILSIPRPKTKQNTLPNGT